jgi:two-component system, OmpR family, response regulator
VNRPQQADAGDDVVLWRTFRRAMVDHRRILVVDDYRDAAEALQILLSADGFECRATNDPLDACAIARGVAAVCRDAQHRHART